MAGAFLWPSGIQGAVSLTYDDGLPVHGSLVGPLLRRHGLAATFYPMIQSDLRVHPERWRALADAGHELGNHSVFHPCRQRPSDPYPWLTARYDLRNYTLEDMRAELEIANLVLHLQDGRNDRSYGSTCCDISVGDGASERLLEPVLKDLFVAARGALTNQIAQPKAGLDLFNLGCIDVAAYTLDGLQRLIEQARANGGWAILIIHGIGVGTHDLFLETDVHERFIGWLAQQEHIWAGPVRDIAGYIRRQLGIGELRS